jgi:hypothetical protein
MPPTDLDERLRRAMALPGRPTASAEAMGSVVSELPRYRARRRARLGATGVSALAVLGLTLGLVVVGFRGPSTPTTEASPSSMCVQVQIGTGPATCAGRVTSIAAGGPPTAAASSAPPVATGAPYAPDVVPHQAATTTLDVAVGARVLVSLPGEPGQRWDHVVLEQVPLENQAQVPSNAVRSLTTHLDRSTGRTVVVASQVTRGRFVLVATTPGSCASPGPACLSTAHVWSITLDVR